MNPGHETLAREFFNRLDTQGDLFALFTDDVEMTFPKWGTARGKQQAGELLQGIGAYIRVIRHDPASFSVSCDGDRVIVEGLSSGQLADGSTWQPDGRCGGRFCTSFRLRDGYICRVAVYLDPDYADRTAGSYPWRR